MKFIPVAYTGNAICQQMVDENLHNTAGLVTASQGSAIPSDFVTMNTLNWVSNVCCFAENGSWGGTGSAPSPTWSQTNCHAACVCA